jgi:GT2 family glycosyltransferase
MSLPKVSIVVLGYLESNRPYLEACLASVAALDYPRELLNVVVVSPYYDEHLPRVNTVVVVSEPGSFSKSVNRGTKVSMAYDFQPDFILVLSDDTLITRDALKNMVALGDSAVIGAMSNCDNNWKYDVKFPVTGDARYYQFAGEPPLNDMINARSPFEGGVLLTETLCFYAVLIPRKVWNAVGELDERFNMGFEDSDYCARAKALGFPCKIAMNALIYHAGGASAAIITDEMRSSNEREFNAKWVPE